MTSPRAGGPSICPELQLVIDREAARGNRLARPVEQTDWPSRGALFACLAGDLHLRPHELPAGVTHTVCTDPRYGWHDECVCSVHGDMLVAGATHTLG